MNREQMVVLRDHLIRGNPPYQKDAMGNLRREKGGTAGLDELKALGDTSPESAVIRLALETSLALIDHLLERMRG